MYMDRKEKVKILSKQFKEDIPEKYLNYYNTAKNYIQMVNLKHIKVQKILFYNYQVNIFIEKQLKLLKNLKNQNQQPKNSLLQQQLNEQQNMMVIKKKENIKQKIKFYMI